MMKTYVVSILLAMAFQISANAKNTVSLKEYKRTKQILRFVGTYMFTGGSGAESPASMVLEEDCLLFLITCSSGRICDIPHIPLNLLGQTVRRGYTRPVRKYYIDDDTLIGVVTTPLNLWTRVIRRQEFKLSGDQLFFSDTQVLQRRKLLRWTWTNDTESMDGCDYAYDYRDQFTKVSNKPLSSAEMWKISENEVKISRKRRYDTPYVDPAVAWFESQNKTLTETRHETKNEVIDLARFRTEQATSSRCKRKSQNAEILRFPGAKSVCEESLTP